MSYFIQTRAVSSLDAAISSTAAKTVYWSDDRTFTTGKLITLPRRPKNADKSHHSFLSSLRSAFTLMPLSDLCGTHAMVVQAAA